MDYIYLICIGKTRFEVPDDQKYTLFLYNGRTEEVFEASIIFGTLTTTRSSIIVIIVITKRQMGLGTFMQEGWYCDLNDTCFELGLAVTLQKAFWHYCKLWSFVYDINNGKSNHDILSLLITYCSRLYDISKLTGVAIDAIMSYKPGVRENIHEVALKLMMTKEQLVQREAVWEIVPTSAWKPKVNTPVSNGNSGTGSGTGNLQTGNAGGTGTGGTGKPAERGKGTTTGSTGAKRKRGSARGSESDPLRLDSDFPEDFYNEDNDDTGITGGSGKHSQSNSSSSSRTNLKGDAATVSDIATGSDTISSLNLRSPVPVFSLPANCNDPLDLISASAANKITSLMYAEDVARKTASKSPYIGLRQFVLITISMLYCSFYRGSKAFGALREK